MVLPICRIFLKKELVPYPSYDVVNNRIPNSVNITMYVYILVLLTFNLLTVSLVAADINVNNQ